MRTYTYEEMLTLPEPEWLVENIILEGTIGLCYGPPKHGKSFIVHDMMAQIGAKSEQWAGHRVLKPVKTLYCLGEGTRAFRWRMESWKMAHPEISVEQYNGALEMYLAAVPLSQPDAVTLLINHAKSIGAELVVLDTWARCIVGIGENDATAIGEAVEQLERIRREVGAVLVVHHTNAAGEEPRGSTALMAAIDYALFMKKNPTDSTRVLVTSRAVKDAEGFQPMEFELKVYGPSVTPFRDYGSGTPGSDMYKPAPRMPHRDRSPFSGTGSPF